MTKTPKKKLPFKHDHRQSTWLIAGGHLMWCYRCGAWRGVTWPDVWYYPIGKNGKNPAMDYEE